MFAIFQAVFQRALNFNEDDLIVIQQGGQLMRRMMSIDAMCTRSRVYSNYWWHAASVVDALVMGGPRFGERVRGSKMGLQLPIRVTSSFISQQCHCLL